MTKDNYKYYNLNTIINNRKEKKVSSVNSGNERLLVMSRVDKEACNNVQVKGTRYPVTI